jgi:hypothetical protein
MYVVNILIVHSLTQTNAKEILDEFINFSPNIYFTLEQEQNNTLNFFLDIKINRCNVKPEWQLRISIHRKPIAIGYIIPYDSCHRQDLRLATI